VDDLIRYHREQFSVRYLHSVFVHWLRSEARWYRGLLIAATFWLWLFYVWVFLLCTCLGVIYVLYHQCTVKKINCRTML